MVHEVFLRSESEYCGVDGVVGPNWCLPLYGAQFRVKARLVGWCKQCSAGCVIDLYGTIPLWPGLQMRWLGFAVSCMPGRHMSSQRSFDLSNRFPWNLKVMPLQVQTSLPPVIPAELSNLRRNATPLIVRVLQFCTSFGTKTFCYVSANAKHQQTQLRGLEF